MSKTHIILLTFVVSLVVGDHLSLVHVIFRHGDRTPLHVFPSDPNQSYWSSKGYGQLTEVGKKQHRELGKWLRGRYVDHYKFLPQKYDSKTIHVQSSKVDRTINSAKSNLNGMFGVKEPRIHLVDANLDTQHLPMTSCPRAVQLYKMMFRLPKVEEERHQSKNLFKRLSNLTGTTQQFYDINKLADTIRIEKSNNLKVSSELDELWPEIKQMERQYFSNMFGLELGEFKGQDFHIELPKVLGGSLLKQILERMKDKAKGKIGHGHKYYAVSAHDVTIMALMATLGLNTFDYDQDHPPGYASALMIELWEKHSGGSPYVRVHYRNDPKAHHIDLSTQIKGCAGRGCSLDKFIELTRQFVPSDVQKLCQTTPSGYYDK